MEDLFLCKRARKEIESLRANDFEGYDVVKSSIGKAMEKLSYLADKNLGVKEMQACIEILISLREYSELIDMLSEVTEKDPTEILRGLCKVYRGESENPFDKLKEEFKFYLWNRERAIVELSSDRDLKDSDEAEEYFKREIQAAIDLYADTPFGGDPSELYEKYSSL